MLRRLGGGSLAAFTGRGELGKPPEAGLCGAAIEMGSPFSDILDTADLGLRRGGGGGARGGSLFIFGS